MLYDGYHFWGMHLIWWFVWLIMIFWLFATPYDFPGKRMKNSSSPLDILKRRFAAGDISKEEYREKKQILEIDKIA